MMTLMGDRTVVAAIGMVLMAPMAIAQSVSAADSAALEQAAAAYAVQHLFKGHPANRALDVQPSGGQVRKPEHNAALARTLGATAAPRDSVIRCGEAPQSCRMHGYGALLTIAIRGVADTVATVSIAIEWPSGRPRIPIYTEEPTLRFVKRRGRWEFDKVVEIRMT